MINVGMVNFVFAQILFLHISEMLEIFLEHFQDCNQTFENKQFFPKMFLTENVSIKKLFSSKQMQP